METSTKKGDSRVTKDTLEASKARDALFPKGIVNNHRSRLRWEEHAVHRGYNSLRGMLYHLYVTQGFTTRELGAELSVSKDRASQLLKGCGIPLRKRGGIRA